MISMLGRFAPEEADADARTDARADVDVDAQAATAVAESNKRDPFMAFTGSVVWAWGRV